MLNDGKDLCILHDLFWKSETKVEEITDLLIEVRNHINDGKKGIEEFVQKFEEEADKLRKERLENFSTSLAIKRSAKEISRLTEITYRLDLIQKFVRSNLIEDHLYHGLLSYFTGNYDKSLEIYDLALEIDSNNPEVWLNKGIVLVELKQKESAIQSFERALEINPNFDEARHYKWLCSLKPSNPEELLEDIESLIEDKQNENYWFNAGETLIKINQLENAVKVLNKALEINPNFTKARLLKGISLFDLEEYEKALDALSYFSRTEVREPEILFWKGKILLKLGQYADSIEAIDKYLAADPENVKALYLKIDALSKINVCIKNRMENKEIVESRENLSDAQKSEKTSLEKNSALLQVDKKSAENPDKWYEDGVKHVENNEYEEAIKLFDKALAIDSQYPKVSEVKGLIFLKLGNLEKSLEAFNLAMITGVKYSDRYTTKSSVDGIFEEYEKSIEILKEKLWKKEIEEFDYSTKKYAINKIIQSELFKLNENSKKEEYSSKNRVVVEKHSSEKELKTSFCKKRRKILKGTGQVVKANGTLLESIHKIDSVKTKNINEETNIKTANKKNLNPSKVAEKTLNKLTYSITNLKNFRNDLGEIKNDQEVYCTVYEIINKLSSENGINNTTFNSQDSTDHFDIEAANKYVLSIIEDFTDLSHEINQGREASSEDILLSKLENIYNRRIEDFHKQIEKKSIQSFEPQDLIFEIKDIVERMKLDSPFSEYPEDNKKNLIGSQAQELKLLFENVCRLSLVNPLMTAIIGGVGSGKTHFLENLEYGSTHSESKRLVLIYQLKIGVQNDTDEIISYIYENKNFRKLLSSNGIKLKDSLERSSKIHEINNSIDIITEVIKEKFSLCIAVDDIDKYFQDIYSKKESDTKKINEDIRSLLGTFRLILDQINNVCIIFSLNPENYKKMAEVAGSDDTLRRRIIVPNGVDGRPVELEKLNEKEAHNLVNGFMKTWIERNRVDKKQINGYTTIWPFEQKTISIAWKIATSVGDFIFTLNETLKEKLNKTISSFEDLRINEVDISRVILSNRLNSNFVDEYRVKQDVWSEIEILAREDEIKANLQKSNENTLSALSNKVELANSFEIYFKELGFVRDHREKDMVIYSETFGSKKIYIKFIIGTKINLMDAKDLAKDLMNSKSGAGLFICIKKNDVGKIKCDLKCEEYFKDSKTNINYVSTVGPKLIDVVDVLHIIKLKEIEEDERVIYAEYIDRKLGFKQYLRSLESIETSRKTVGIGY